MKDLTLDELRARRAMLEDKIMRLVTEFEMSTGVEVIDIDIASIDTSTRNGEGTQLHTIDIFLDL